MVFRLRLKIILTVLAVLLAVFIIVLGMINIYMNMDSVRQTDMFLHFLIEAQSALAPGKDDIPAPPDRLWPVALRSQALSDAPGYLQQGGFFVARVSAAGEILSLDLERMYEYGEEEAGQRALEAVRGGEERGSIGTLQYLVQPDGDGFTIAFAEKTASNHLLRRLLKVSIYVALGSSVLLLVLSVFLSKWVVRPVQVAFEKQKAFISDASHELKTPLTILSANTDMLRLETGPNKWVDGIATQSARMKALIDDLLALARYEEGTQTAVRETFDLSEIVRNTALEFESLIYEEGKTVCQDIPEDISYTGDPAAIKQAIAILIDNAIKHSAQGAMIRVTLGREHGGARIGVYNAGAGIPPQEQKKVFERFYRSDASRSRETGGVGLGLAIAKSIAELHGGRIAIESGKDEGVWMWLVL